MTDYKIRMPVMKRTCRNCKRDITQHMPDGKCLFEASDFKQGGITTSNQTIKCHVTVKVTEKK
jgi:hypothetical protein